MILLFVSVLVVVVTGATGFIATHVINQLQRAGHRVRGTACKLSSADKLRNLCPGAKYPVEFVEADLEKSETWDRCVLKPAVLMYFNTRSTMVN